jgi:hypothetical protein
MANRLTLQTKLEVLLGSRNVYYQPPSTVNMNYPAIVYSKAQPNRRFANDKTYINKSCYELTVIDKKPDNPIIDKLMELPYCSFNRHYVSDNLNHDVLTIYY